MQAGNRAVETHMRNWKRASTADVAGKDGSLRMSRLFITLAATAAVAAGSALIPAPATAQAGQTQLIIFGNDPCPSNYICVRRGESERYRIPEQYRPNGTLQDKQPWAQRSKVLETVGDTGINSCSPVGPAGFTGCMIQGIKEARQQRREQAEDNKPPQ
jgi:hypothetical protein